MKRQSLLLVFAMFTAMQVFPVNAETYSQLLEKAVYEEEVSGDLKAAIKTYERILDASKADQAIIAEAMFRMAHCHIRTGETAVARDILNTLVYSYPEQKGYTTKAKDLLAESQLTLLLPAAPWQDSEVNRYRLISPAGKEIGIMDGSIRRTTAEGNAVWDVHFDVIAPLLQLRQHTNITMAENDLHLIRADDKSTLAGHVVSLASKGVVKRIEGDKASEIQTDSLFFHKDQIPYLLRQMTLPKDEEIQLSAYDALTDNVVQMSIKLIGNEEVEVAGTQYEAQRIQMKVGSMNKYSEHEDIAWISIGPNRQLLKYKTQYATMLLDKTYKNTKTNLFAKDGTSIKMQLPEDWRFYDATVLNPGYDAFAILLAPTFDIDAMFVSKSIGEDLAKTISVSQIVDGDLQAIKGYFKDYIVRKGTRIDHKISEMAAQTYVADYEFQKKNMVEYRTYILGKQDIYWFVFRLEKGQLPEFKSQIDALVAELSAE